MLGNILPPYHSLQELNLDWILTKVKNILRFVPDDGAVGQILRRTSYGAEWSDEQGAGGSVTSVNGQQGAVVLDAADVGALPASTVIPDSTSDLINDSGFVNAAGAAAAAPVQSVNGQTGAVVIPTGGAVDSVNGQTGTVVLDASDVGALPDSYVAPVTSVNGQTGAVSLSIPDSTSDLINDSGFVNAAGAASAAPVQSVNGQTGAVSLSIPTFGAVSYKFENLAQYPRHGYYLDIVDAMDQAGIPQNAVVFSIMVDGWSDLGTSFGLSFYGSRGIYVFYTNNYNITSSSYIRVYFSYYIL